MTEANSRALPGVSGSPPFRFGLSAVASMATEQVSSIADLHRQLNDLWDLDTHYRGFYNQFVKDQCPEFFRPSLCDIMGKLIHAAANFASFFALRGLSIPERPFWRMVGK